MKTRTVACLVLFASLAIPIGLTYAEPPKTQTPPPPQAVTPAPSGVIDDSTVNRLAIGMSDAEVFSLAGPPKYPGGDNLPYASRWVYIVGDQFVELSFGSGHVVEIKRLQSQGGMAR